MGLGALEHQMLEEVGDAALAGSLIGAADLVPQHVRDDRGAPVRDDDDLKAIVEREMGDVRRLVGRRRLRRGRVGRFVLRGRHSGRWKKQ